MKSGGAHVSTSRERHVPRSGSSLTVHRIFWVEITWSTVSPVVIIVYHVTRDEDPDPMIFGPPDPDPALFSTDPDPDPTCNNGSIKLFLS